MLVVTVKKDEKVLIGDEITILVVDIRGNQVRLGVEAPADISVLRGKAAKREKGGIQ